MRTSSLGDGDSGRLSSSLTPRLPPMSSAPKATPTASAAASAAACASAAADAAAAAAFLGGRGCLQTGPHHSQHALARATFLRLLAVLPL